MKVLSLTEPFATLIKEKKKFIETRSWKTEYRGELYIHASMTKILKNNLENKELMTLLENKNMNFGYIICKCNLVDCIYMTNEYIKKMKDDNYQEYICGEYSVGRYAWILEDITPLKLPIKAKGQLGIWNYYNEEEIMNLMENIEYGYIDKNNKKHSTADESYLLQSPQQTIKNKIGICWDQVELERYYFKKTNYNTKTYFLLYYENDRCHTHTFLIFEKNNNYYWFEHSWNIFKGIHKYNSINKLLLDVRNKFINDQLNNNYKKENLILYEYTKPKYNITSQEFFNHCNCGNHIDFKEIEK